MLFLTNATVQILQGSTVVASTTTNNTGNYSITGVAPGTYTLSAGLINYTTGTTAVVVVSNQTTTTNLALQPQAGTVSGQIISGATSLPLSGVSVVVIQGSTTVGSAVTNALGTYTVSNLTPGTYTVQFSLNNYQTVSQPQTVTSNATVTANATLQFQPGNVSGTILNAQTNVPLGGITITAFQGATPIATTNSGSNGSYNLTALPVGTYTITATGTNFQSISQTSVVVSANQTTTVNLSLTPTPGIVSGTITDSTTTLPIVGATVSVLQNGTTIGTTSSITAGAYSITNVAPGNYTLVVNATGYQSASQPLTITSNATTTASVALQVSPGAITGFVTDTTTLLPISGATVQVLNGNTVLATVTTAVDGSFTISGLAPAVSGTYTFRASATNYQTATTTAAIVANVTTPASFVLAAQPGSLSGTITNVQTGTGISGAGIQVFQGVTLMASATANSSGVYAVSGLAPGSYTVSISAANFQTISVGTTINANTTTTLNRSLQPLPGTLSGVITDSATSNPLALATVSVWNQGVQIASTVTLGDGSYSIGGLTPGNYTIVASDTNYQNNSVSATIFANQVTTLNLALLSLPGGMTGTVISGVTPIVGATVSIQKGNTVVATATTDVNGNYTSTGLAPGSYNVTVSASTYQSATSGAIVVANATAIVNFSLLAQPGSINGVLVDAVTHLPISGAVVSVLSGNVSVATAVTASDGSYTCGGLSPGPYVVTAVALNYQTISQGCTVQAQATVTVNLSLQSQPGSLSGSIVDVSTSVGISGAVVNISQGNIQVASVLTDVNGFYSAGSLAPGSYTVAVQATNYQSLQKGCVILANTNTSLDFALLSSPGTIIAHVLDRLSNPILGAFVNVYSGSVLLLTQASDSQGNVSFQNLAPGTYTLIAQATNFQAGTQSVTVTANATSSVTFALQVDPGNCTCTILDALTSQPLSGANATLLQGSTVIATSVTSALGTCQFPGLAPGSYVVRVTASNYQTVAQGVTIQANLTATISLSLQPQPGAVSGVISDAVTGLAISSANIDVIAGGVTIASVTTDNNGAYLVNSLAPGAYSLRISAMNYQTSLQVCAVLANQTTRLNVGLQATPGNVAISIVDSVTANPIAGATVSLYSPLSNIAVATVLADATGNCLISGIAPGVYNAVVSASGYQNLSLSVTVVANGTTTLNLVLLANPGSISCLVQDSVSLLPVSGCLVEALSGTTVVTTGITDALGGCLLSGLAPGSYIVRVTATNYQISTQAAIVTANGQTAVVVNLMLDPGTLTGNVIDALTALVLPQAQVSLFSGQTLVAATVTDVLGNFVFTSLAPGTYTLRVTLLNYETLTATVTITAQQTTHHDCNMHSQPGNITGSVTDAVTTNPIAGAEITVFNGSTSVADVLTDSSGNYSVTGLSPNVNYTVRCSATNYQVAVQGATVQSNQTKVVNFSLNSQPGSIVGQVTDGSTSTAIAGASVNLLQGSVSIASAQTDSSGNYQLLSLAPGSYTLQVGASSYQTVVVSAQVQANQATTVNVVLQANPGNLQGTVTDVGTSLPLPNTQIQVRSGSVLVGSVNTDQNGQYTLSGLAPGQYTITATITNYQTVVQSGTIQSGQTTTVNFALQANPGSIIGTVTAAGNPVSGATVTAYQGSSVLATGTTDGNGNYVMANLAPGQYTVVASAAGYQNASQGVQVQANQSASANFSLAAQPGSITGTVTGAAANIDLLLGSSPVASTVTANDGSYSFSSLAPGSYTVRFQAQGYQTAILGASVTANTTTVVNITLQSQPGSVIGTVVDANTSTPLSGVTIDLLQNSSVIESIFTDSSGHYSIGNLAPGNYNVRATLNDYQIAVQGVMIQANVVSTANFNLSALPGNIAGQVTDVSTGSLLIDAEVDVFQGSVLIASTVTDGNGNYLVSNLAPGNYTVRAIFNSYQTSIQSCSVSATATTTLNFTLMADPGSVVGQVIDASSGLPITTASVSVNILQSNVIVGSAITDSNGNYRIDGLAPGSYTLQLAAPGYQSVSQGLTITANMPTTANVALTAQPGSISGTITDASTSTSISGATVEILQGSVIFETVLSDANGAYTAAQLAPGSYTVRVSASNYQTAVQNAIVQTNTTATVNVQLQSQPGSLTGVITDASGNPLSGTLVVAKEGITVISSVIADPSGNYVITGLAPGTYTVFASLNGYQTAFGSIAITANTTSQLSFSLLPQSGSASGLVLDAVTSQPIASATIDFLQNGTVVATVQTDASGQYTIGGLAPGQYTLRVLAANYQTVSQGIVVTSSGNVVTNLSLQGLPGSLSGIVTDSTTTGPVPNATVQTYQGAVLITTGMTDGNGAYTLSGLAAGNYTVVVSAANYQNFSQGVSVQLNTITTANAALMENPATVTGTISDALTTNPLANVAVQIVQGNVVVGSALTDANGQFTISGLTAGNYVLNLIASGYQSSTTMIVVTAGQTVTTNIALNANPGTITGTVLDSSTNLPVTGANISVLQGSSVVTSQMTDSNGGWTAQNLAPGSYTIVVSATAYQTNAQGANVQAGISISVTTLLASQPGSVAGQIESLSLPVTGATVEVLQGNTVVASVLTDSSGNYALSSLAPGSYSIRASAPNLSTVQQGLVITANQQTIANFILNSDPGAIAGQLTEASTTQPISGVTIHVFRAGALIASTTTDSNGNYQVGNLSPGNYTLTTSSSLYQTISQGVAVSANQTTALNLALQDQPGDVSGQVTDQTSGLTLSGASVSILNGNNVIATGLTDSNGNYDVTGLPPGSYTLRVSLNGYQTVTQAVIVSVASTTAANIVLAANPGSAAGQVTDSSGVPITSGSVVLRVMQGNVMLGSTLTDSNGAYLIENLPAGSYTLSVIASGYQNALGSLVIQSGQTTTLDFMLAAQPGGIAGTVQDSVGPLAGASVQVFSNTALVVAVVTDNNGNYQVSNLAPGVYTVVVLDANHQTSTQTVTVQAGVTTTVNSTLVESPATVIGQITDASTTNAIVGATVQVFNGQTVIGSGLTDSQGFYNIGSLPEGNFVLTVNVSNYQGTTQSVNLLAGQTATVNQALQASAGSILGSVLNNSSQPIAGATIYLIQGTTTVASTLTDASGNYIFNGVAAGTYSVEATATGYQFGLSSTTVTAGAAITTNFVLQSNPGSVQGVATDGTNPLSNVLVQVFNGNTLVASVFTDASGNYVLPNLAPGNYTIQASLNGYQTSTQGLQVSGSAATTTNFALQSLPSTVNGTVTDATTTFVLPGIAVNSYVNNVLIASVLTNGSGQYVLPGLSSGNYVFTAVASGYQTGVSGLLVPQNSTQTLNFSLLQQPGSVIGVLTDVNGVPIVGATVTISQNNVVVASVTSISDGSYTLPGLAPGSYTVTASAPSFQGNTQGVIVTANQSVALDFTLQSQSSTFSGSVVDGSSQPITGGQVTVAQNGVNVATAITGQNGTFSMSGLGTGNYTVTITAAQYQTASAGIILSAGQQLTRTFTLAVDIGAIQGIVRDTSANPLSNATIVVSQSSITVATVITDANGSYTVTNLSPGSYVVTCSLANYQTVSQGATVTANITTIVDFNLSSVIGYLEGTMTDAVSGTAVANATVSIYSQGILISTVTTNANGFYWVGGLAPNTYTINIQAAGYQTVSESVLIQAGLTTETSVGLLANPGTVQGLVQSVGVPVVNATVSVAVLQGNTVVSNTQTDSNGNYRVSGLQPGSYVIKVNASGYQTQVQSVTISANQTAIANFDLQTDPGLVSGVVVDASTLNSVANAQIQVVQGSVVVNTIFILPP